ncbi:hypothetical protein O7598_05050 [Micromonospora sp. WMMC241]|uniref:hypothetical protein n=1 Tax=Micromonospora sp. WMMC241 TaxID=3015159 RepID=UPI0022B6E601|nr:hypothetical protein [Micromonospora sp. WMMC241]MCZ7435754.1 hypothetical protein [Micromonospora sp. WMMC241]
MAKKMLGKVVAGAALGGAGLLVFTPGLAYAGGHDDEGKVIAKPHVVKAGDTVELLQICSEPQEHAYVWSKVTGKVDLHPARDGEHGDWADGSDWADRGGDWADRGGDWADADQGPDGKDAHGGDDHGKGPDGKDEQGKDEHGKGPEGKGPEGKDEQGKDGHGPGEAGMPQPPADAPQSGGTGAGAAVDPAAQGPEEYGQAAEPGWDAADWADDEHGKDGKDGHGPDGKEAEGEHGKGPEAKDDHGKGPDAKDEHGKGPEAKDDHGKGPEAGDEYGKDGKDEHGAEWQGGDAWQGGDEYGSGGDEAGWEHGKDFVYYGEARVSEDVHPGRYELRGSCGEGELVVLPHGGVDGGDGGMAGTGLDRGLATGGAGMIGAAALGGLVLLRRRRAGDLV